MIDSVHIFKQREAHVSCQQHTLPDHTKACRPFKDGRWGYRPLISLFCILHSNGYFHYGSHAESLQISNYLGKRPTSGSRGIHTGQRTEKLIQTKRIPTMPIPHGINQETVIAFHEVGRRFGAIGNQCLMHYSCSFLYYTGL